jgi:hypothetical protein
VREKVGGGHRHDHAMIRQGLLEAGDDLVALLRGGIERHQVVVMQIHAIRAQLAQLGHDPLGCDGRAHRIAKRVAPHIPYRPKAKGELVFLAGGKLIRHDELLLHLAMRIKRIRCAPGYHRLYEPSA